MILVIDKDVRIEDFKSGKFSQKLHSNLFWSQFLEVFKEHVNERFIEEMPVDLLVGALFRSTSNIIQFNSESFFGYELNTDQFDEDFISRVISKKLGKIPVLTMENGNNGEAWIKGERAPIDPSSWKSLVFDKCTSSSSNINFSLESFLNEPTPEKFVAINGVVESTENLLYLYSYDHLVLCEKSEEVKNQISNGFPFELSLLLLFKTYNICRTSILEAIIDAAAQNEFARQVVGAFSNEDFYSQLNSASMNHEAKINLVKTKKRKTL